MPSRPIAVFLHDTVGLISGVLKGSVRRIMAASSLQNADGTTDVTVTGTRLDTSADVVSSVLPTGAATEATLAAANVNLADIETLITAGNVDLAALLTNSSDIETILTAIRDTAGIKKITDALPAGTNEIGKVRITDGTVDATITTDGSAERLDVSAAIPGTIDSGNSTTATLGAGGTFTGAAFDALNCAICYVTVFADVASAADGLAVEQSSDGVNWDNNDLYTVPASNGKTYSIQCAARYVRVRYTNGASPQTAFRLQTKFAAVYGKPSNHRIQDNLSDEDDAELVVSVIKARKADGTFVSVSADENGNLQTVAAAAPPGSIFRKDLEDGASSPNMNVDGSSVPVVFTVSADPVNDINLQELRLTISGPKVFRFDGATFGEGSGDLTNGILVEATVNGGTTVTLANIVRNEGFFRLQSTGVTPFYAANGANELVAVSFVFGGGQLEGGSADEVKITIRDDITPGSGGKVKHFRATVYGEVV